MTREENWNTLCWYVVHTNPRQEDRAESNLRAWGIEIFAPKIRECRYNQFNGKPTFIIKPLFPRYIFARFKIQELLHKVRYTRGVHDIVSFDNSPTPVSDEIITFLKEQINEDGFVELSSEIKSGDKVQIESGPLKDFTCIFEREMNDSDRVKILLQTVNYQAHIIIEKKMIKKIG
jgi:transcriptional antiterminator RfaH